MRAIEDSNRSSARRPTKFASRSSVNVCVHAAFGRRLHHPGLLRRARAADLQADGAGKRLAGQRLHRNRIGPGGQREPHVQQHAQGLRRAPETGRRFKLHRRRHRLGRRQAPRVEHDRDRACRAVVGVECGRLRAGVPARTRHRRAPWDTTTLTIKTAITPAHEAANPARPGSHALDAARDPPERCDDGGPGEQQGERPRQRRAIRGERRHDAVERVAGRQVRQQLRRAVAIVGDEQALAREHERAGRGDAQRQAGRPAAHDAREPPPGRATAQPAARPAAAARRPAAGPAAPIRPTTSHRRPR